MNYFKKKLYARAVKNHMQSVFEQECLYGSVYHRMLDNNGLQRFIRLLKGKHPTIEILDTTKIRIGQPKENKGKLPKGSFDKSITIFKNDK